VGDLTFGVGNFRLKSSPDKSLEKQNLLGAKTVFDQLFNSPKTAQITVHWSTNLAGTITQNMCLRLP